MAKKEIKQLMTPEQKLQEQIEKLKNADIPEPMKFYSVGEAVRFGGFSNTTVKAIFENGKILHLISNKLKSGNGASDIKNEEYDVERVVTWNEVLPKFESDHYTNTFFNKPKLQIQYSNGTIYTLLAEAMPYMTSLYDGKDKGIFWDPIYQRDFVWTEKQKQDLIISMLEGKDIGKFVYYRYPYKELAETGYAGEMIDGKQRLRAIMDFLIGKFKVQGKSFFEFHPHDISVLRHYNILISMISEPLTIPQRIEYFLHVNISGVPQSEEHITKLKKMLING